MILLEQGTSLNLTELQLLSNIVNLTRIRDSAKFLRSPLGLYILVSLFTILCFVTMFTGHLDL